MDEFEKRIQKLFNEIVNELPKTKLQKIYKAFSWQINSPTLDISILNESYNSTLFFTILTCLIKGKMLLLGPSGTGKSTIVETAAQLLFGDKLSSLQAATVHCSPGLTVDDLEQAFITRDVSAEKKGIEQISVLFIDDLSSLDPHTETILNTLFEEGIIVHRNTRYELAAKPLFATTNKILFDDVRSRALQDRFHISTIPTGINPGWIYNLVAGVKFHNITKLSLFLTDDDITQINQEISQISIGSHLLFKLEFFISELTYCDMISTDINFKNKIFAFLNEQSFIEKLCRNCFLRTANPLICCKDIIGSVSTRALESAIRYFKAASWLTSDSGMITEEIVEQLIPFMFLHRIEPSIWAMSETSDHASRIPWIRQMWNNSMQTFDAHDKLITDFKTAIAQSYTDEKITKSGIRQLSELKHAIAEMNTPARYNYLVTLNARMAERGISLS